MEENLIKSSDELALYSLTLQKPSAIVCSIVGRFSGHSKQEIITAQGSWLELLKQDEESGKLIQILRHNVFGIIRKLCSFRVAGASKDHLIVSSDSGRITILEYKRSTNSFIQIHLETFGKTGIRRVVPGEYLAVDAKGRATMIASIEKNKLVYVLNRDSLANLTISSPLEAHTSRNIMFDLVGLDVGYANPIFASIEANYSESLSSSEFMSEDLEAYLDTNSNHKNNNSNNNNKSNNSDNSNNNDNNDNDQINSNNNISIRVPKLLNYYELDLGLNHVVRRWSTEIDPTSNKLIALPGDKDGPSGVLICSENYITYRHIHSDPLIVPIPRRRHPQMNPSRKMYITAGTVHKLKDFFFVLLQNQEGDVFNVTLSYKDEVVDEMYIKYFDSLPLAVELNILRSGFLFLAAEYGNHKFYQFEKIGDNDDEIVFSSRDYYDTKDVDKKIALFNPKPLDNLALIDEIPALNPLLGSAPIEQHSESVSPEIYTISGQGPKSSFRILENGLEVSELVSSELPGAPINVFTTKLSAKDEFDSYIILSFENGTLILSIGEVVEEVTDSGILDSVATIAIQQIGDEGIIQIHSRGIRHIHSEEPGIENDEDKADDTEQNNEKKKKKHQIDEWEAPAHRTIVAASANSRQVVIALSSGEIVYFEMDEYGQLNEFEDRKSMEASVSCLAIGDVPEGRLRCSFLAIGCDDSTIRMISLEPDSTLETISIQALTAAPSSLCILSMRDQVDPYASTKSSLLTSSSSLYLHIGLNSGVYIRTLLDSVTGQLSDSRTRFLGPKLVKLHKVKVLGQDIILAISTRAWLGYISGVFYQLTPLAISPLISGSAFSSPQCAEGLVGIEGNNLKILTVENLSTNIKQESISLKDTPRRIVKHPLHDLFYVIEADANIIDYGYEEYEEKSDVKIKQEDEDDENDEDEDDEELKPEFVYPSKLGSWSSCIQIVDANLKSVVNTVKLDQNDAAFSVCLCTFDSHSKDKLYLVVGAASDLKFTPKSYKCGYIYIYEINENDSKSISFLHKTKVSEPVLALKEFHGRLLVGVGKSLRIYDMGMKQMLRKAEHTFEYLNNIVTLDSMGYRIVVGDLYESVTYVVYKPADNIFIPFSDDFVTRHIVCATMIDYDTVAGSDKWGNFFVVRIDDSVSRESDADIHGTYLRNERPYLDGTAHRVDIICNYYSEDIITSLQKASLAPGGREVLVYTGLQGTVGTFIPLISKEDFEFFSQLEGFMRTHEPPICGRDHLIFRSYYNPVRNVIDGDLCERYGFLSREKRETIAGELERTVKEVDRKISDMRARFAF